MDRGKPYKRSQPAAAPDEEQAFFVKKFWREVNYMTDEEKKTEETSEKPAEEKSTEAAK